MKAAVVLFVMGIAYWLDRRNWRNENRGSSVALHILWGIAALYGAIAVTTYRSLLPNPLKGIIVMFHPFGEQITRWLG